MKLLGFNVRLSVNVLNLRRLLSIVIRYTSLFGVGGSGRKPIQYKPRPAAKMPFRGRYAKPFTTLSAAVRRNPSPLFHDLFT